VIIAIPAVLDAEPAAEPIEPLELEAPVALVPEALVEVAVVILDPDAAAPVRLALPVSEATPDDPFVVEAVVEAAVLAELAAAPPVMVTSRSLTPSWPLVNVVVCTVFVLVPSKLPDILALQMPWSVVTLHPRSIVLLQN
jgi:hypothetical protein